ncbi:hypothetical protein N0V82_008030 [Gnomoniopsis sp. IMI 355080]|nr:hypothetical protein N0V82_008030 [Gnomoniopsis sp. IMI 355080]
MELLYTARIGKRYALTKFPPRLDSVVESSLVERTSEMRARFYKEVHALWRLDGTIHKHLLTMLTAFVHTQHFYFIFPWANYDLVSYWDRTAWTWEAHTFEWTLQQIHGLMGAIVQVHELTHTHKSRLEPHEQDRFGLHADIKPDNILFFKSPKHPRGIFILSDFGLASFHRLGSRSNIPNREIPGVPGYRPPECDVEGGTISRKYDVWTLGCLFLEMATWLLGGPRLLKEFETKADVLYITGGLRKMFYLIKEVKEIESNVQIRATLIGDRESKVSPQPSPFQVILGRKSDIYTHPPQETTPEKHYGIQVNTNVLEV